MHQNKVELFAQGVELYRASSIAVSGRVVLTGIFSTQPGARQQL
jgi:hypothetical protein